jgi:hypothetical protein
MRDKEQRPGGRGEVSPRANHYEARARCSVVLGLEIAGSYDVDERRPASMGVAPVGLTSSSLATVAVGTWSRVRAVRATGGQDPARVARSPRCGRSASPRRSRPERRAAARAAHPRSPRRGGARTSRRQPGAPPRSAQPSQAHVSPSSTTRARGRSRTGPGDARSPWPPAAPDQRAAAHDRSAQDACSSSTSRGAAGTSARPNVPGRRSPGLAPCLGACSRRLRGGLGCR